MEEVDNRQKKKIKELQGRFFIKKNHFLSTTHPLIQPPHLQKSTFSSEPGILMHPNFAPQKVQKRQFPDDRYSSAGRCPPVPSYLDSSVNKYVTDLYPSDISPENYNMNDITNNNNNNNNRDKITNPNPKSVYNNTTNNVNINLNNYSSISQLIPISPSCFPVFDINTNNDNNNNLNNKNNNNNNVYHSHISTCTNMGKICGKRVREIENEQLLISNTFPCTVIHNNNNNNNLVTNNYNNNNQNNNLKNILSEIITGSEGNNNNNVEEIVSTGDIQPNDVLSLINHPNRRTLRAFDTPKLFPPHIIDIDSYCNNYSANNNNINNSKQNNNFNNENNTILHPNIASDSNNFITISNKMPEINIRIIYIKLSNGMETRITELDITKILQIKRTISERYAGYPISDLSIYANCTLLSDDISLKDISKEKEIILHLYREITLNYHSKMGEMMRIKLFDNSPLQLLALKLSQSENEEIRKVIYNDMEILLNSPVPISALLRYPQSAIYMELVFPSLPYTKVEEGQLNLNNNNGSELCGSSLPFYDFFTDSFQYSTLNSFPSDSIR